MEFAYYKVVDFPKHQKRQRALPWIRVGIYNPEKYNLETSEGLIYPLGLIDSGSDTTIIHREIGEELGFDIESGKEGEISGLGGGRIKVYFHKVGFKISDLMEKEEPIMYEDYAGFTDKHFPISNPQQTAIFGTVGFFNHLGVCFKYPESIWIEKL